MSISLSTVGLNDHPQEEVQHLLTGLAETGRVVLSKTGEWLVLDPDRGVYTTLRSRDALARLEVHGLVAVVNEDGGPAGARAKGDASSVLSALIGDPLVAQFLPTVASVVRQPAFTFVGRQSGPRTLQRRKNAMDAADAVLTIGAPVDTSTVDPAYPHLKTVFSGLTFQAPVYYPNLIGITCAMFARTAMGPFPIVLLDARKKSSGKSTLAEALVYLLTGREGAEPIVYTGEEQELERRFGMFCGRAGPNLIWIDNVRAKTGQAHQIRSQLLSAMATTRCVRVRGLYREPAPLFDPIVIATMNGVRVEGDLSDKVVRVSLAMKDEGALHQVITPNPLHYAQEYRREIVAEACHVLESIGLDPVPSMVFSTRFYDFESVAVAAAKHLGFDCTFRSDTVDSADAFLEELFRVVTGEFTRTEQEVTFPALVNVIQANPGLRELNTFLDTLHGTKNTLPTLLRNHLVAFTGRRYRVGDSVVSFSIGKSAALNQQTLILTLDETGE